MARSVGEAAALGLDAGFRLATDFRTQQRQEERQTRLDQQSLEDRQRRVDREDTHDQLQALDAQGKMLAQEGAGLAAGSPDAATQAEYASRVSGLNERRNKILGKASGYDVRQQQQLGLEGLQKLRANDLANLKPGDFTRTITVATRRPTTDYIRQGEAPSTVEQAGEDFMDGMEKGDTQKMLRGVNVMYAPELRAGVGTTTQHGTIVGKQIVGLDHDPRSPQDDPHVVPRIRVYVTGGTPLRGPLPEGAPKGATGYYDAPLTQNRTSDPNDPVRAIGMQEALDYMEKQGKLVEMMNSPEAQERLKIDAATPAFNQQEYLQALTKMGVPKVQPTQSEYSLKPNEERHFETREPRTGKLLSERVVRGADKPDDMQTRIDAVEEDETLTPRQKAVEKRAIRSGIKPGKYSGDGSGGSGGGSAAPGGKGLKEREQDRKELKDKFERADKAADNAENAVRDFRTANKRPPSATANGGADRKQYEADLADLTNKAKRARKRADDMNSELDKPDEEPAKPAAGTKPKAAIKFDANGKRVP